MKIDGVSKINLGIDRRVPVKVGKIKFARENKLSAKKYIFFDKFCLGSLKNCISKIMKAKLKLINSSVDTKYVKFSLAVKNIFK